MSFSKNVEQQKYMSFELTNSEVVVYQLTTEIKEESMHDNLTHEEQVFRPDKYPINMKKDQINFLFKI
jgi:hypothetical protein